MNKRVFPRKAINLPADYSTGKIGPNQQVHCQLLDYSYGGLMIEIPEQEHFRISQGDRGTISFMATVDGQSSLYQVRARICRIDGRHIGASFDPEPAARTRKALESVASETEQQQDDKQVERALLPKEKLGDFLRAVWGAVDRPMNLTMRSMLPQLHAALMAQSKQTLNKDENKALLNSLGELSLQWDSLFQHWQDDLRHKILQLRDKPLASFGGSQPEASADSLSIVGESEFEEWLTVKSTVADAEHFHRDALSLMNHALSVAAGRRVDDRNNPLGPALLAEAFHVLFDPLFQHPVVHDIYFRTFEESVLMNLGEIYDEVKKVFESWDLLKDAQASRSREQSRGLRPKESSAKKEKTATSEQPSPAGRKKKDTAEELVVPLSEKSPLLDEIESRPDSHPGLERLLQQLAARPVAKQARADKRVTVVGDEVLLNFLSESPFTVPTDGTAPLSFSEWMQENLQKEMPEIGNAVFSESQKSTMDLAGQLFDAISNRDLLPEQTINWLRQLQGPILKLLLEDKDFLWNSHHPARETINQLARLGGDSEVLKSGLDQTLNQTVQRIVTEHAEDPGVFREALATLTNIVERRQSSFLEVIRRTQHTQDGRQRLHEARGTVNQFLARKIGRRPVLNALKELIEESWRDLLVTSFVRSGVDGEEYHKYMRVLEILLAWLRLPEPPIFAEEYREKHARSIANVLKVLKLGLDNASGDIFVVASLHDNFEALLNGKQDTLPANLLESSQLDPSFTDISTAVQRDTDLSSMPLAERNHMRRLQKISPGTVIMLEAGTPQLKRCRLAWVAPDLSRMVLADDRGGNLREMLQEEVLTKMKAGKFEILDEESDSLMDTGILEYIQKGVKRLADDSARDELTGALTRREFMRELEKCTHEAQRNAAERTLLYLNVDHFDLLNSKLGHTAADQFLAYMHQLLADTLDESIAIGRLGSDEFGILLGTKETRRSAEVAESLRAIVENSPFPWKKNELKQTISIGGVIIAEVEGNPDTVLRAAMDVCQSAKDQGRNRVLFHNLEDDSLQSRKRIMTWAARIYDLIDNDRLGLRIQPILPLQEGDKHSHHEVLLLVKDEAGTPVSPQDFIIAAETYNHAQDVDRWVVRTLLQWVHDNPKLTKKAGCFAINLSGASVNDGKFLDFLLAEIRTSNINPASLSFEITETAMVSNLQQATEFIQQVRDAGCAFALDDFGAGMASYAYLKSMPVDYLKIDGIFIREIISTPADLAVVRSINEVAHFLGIKTIAEFVENDEILEKVRELGVDYSQGWATGKPILLNDFTG